MLEAIEPFFAVPKRSPAAGPANVRKVRWDDGTSDALEQRPPAQDRSRVQSQPLQYHPVLCPHRLLRSLSIEATADRGTMGASPADRIGLLDDFDRPVPMCVQLFAESGQMCDERWAIPFASKPLEAQQHMPSEANGRMLLIL